jgi:hypothetical protein
VLSFPPRITMNENESSPFSSTPTDTGYRPTERERRLVRLRSVIASMVTLALLALPIVYSLADDETIGIPQSVAASAVDGASKYAGITSTSEVIAANPAPIASDANLVANQADPAQANGAPKAEPGYAAGMGGPRNERAASLNGDMYSGGLLVGLLALEYASQHPHH